MKYYCLGIKGSGMATLACFLHDLGNQVSGYDDVKDWKFTEKGLDEREIPIFYQANLHLEKDTIVTYSKALKEDHPELKRVRELGFLVKEYSEIVGELTNQFQTISVSGTHGKTTTTSLISHILNHTLGCNYFIGDGRGHAEKENSLFVLESDEFNRHFLAYHPTISVITNIELEHTECYRDIEDIIQTFETFASHTKELLVVCGDNENIRKIHFSTPVIYYGLKENNDYVVKNIQVDQLGSSFDVYEQGNLYGHFQVPLFGKHMVLNTLASIIVTKKLGIEKEKIEAYLMNFHNAERRFQEKVIGNIVTIDDYAHHPTEIKVTLEAARAKYPEKTLVAVFKPNTYSRTKDFYQDFSDALQIADQVYVTEIDCNRESQEDYPNVTSHLILDLIPQGKMISDETVSELLQYPNAVVCFMSCANIQHLKEKYEQLVEESIK